MIVDGFAHCGESRFGWGVDAKDLLDEMDRAEVDAAVVCPVQRRDRRIDLANRDTVAAAESAPARLLHLARVDPLQEGALEEFRHVVEEQGAHGLYLDPWEDSFRIDVPEVLPLVAQAAAMRVPVMVSAGCPWVSEALQLSRLAERFPAVTFLATSGAQVNIAGLGQVDAEILIRRCSNVVLVSNGVYRDDFIARIIADYGADRLVFGSSHPVLDIAYERTRIEMSRIADAARVRVLGDNVAQLFGIEAA